MDGIENLADCASRGLFPSELLGHDLWWNGPTWLKLPSTSWPQQSTIPPVEPSVEEREMFPCDDSTKNATYSHGSILQLHSAEIRHSLDPRIHQQWSSSWKPLRCPNAVVSVNPRVARSGNLLVALFTRRARCEGTPSTQDRLCLEQHSQFRYST